MICTFSFMGFLVQCNRASLYFVISLNTKIIFLSSTFQTTRLRWGDGGKNFQLFSITESFLTPNKSLVQLLRNFARLFLFPARLRLRKYARKNRKRIFQHILIFLFLCKFSSFVSLNSKYFSCLVHAIEKCEKMNGKLFAIMRLDLKQLCKVNKLLRVADRHSI